MFSRVFLALFNFGYKLVQDVIMTKVKQWMRFNVLDIIFKTNNENMSNINFTKLATPINRLSNTCYMIISDMLNYSLPYIMFVLVTMVYFVYENRMIGLMFIIGNVLAILLMIYMWKIMWNRSNNYEKSNLYFERHVTEVLNNIDKILTRGQKNYETGLFAKESSETRDAHRDYYYSVSAAKFMIELITLLTMFVCTGYSIHLFMKNKLSTIQFVSIFTLLMVFKERMNVCASLASAIRSVLIRFLLKRPFKGLRRPCKGLRKAFKGLVKPFKGVKKAFERPFKGLQRLCKGLRKAFKGLLKPFKGL